MCHGFIFALVSGKNVDGQNVDNFGNIGQNVDGLNGDGQKNITVIKTQPYISLYIHTIDIYIRSTIDFDKHNAVCRLSMSKSDAQLEYNGTERLYSKYDG